MVAIWQRHGRTCCLRPTSCRMAVLLSVMLLTRQIFGWEVCRTRRWRIATVLGSRSGRWEVRWSNLLVRWVLRSRRWICGRGLGFGFVESLLFMDQCANLTASIGLVQLYPSNEVLTRSDLLCRHQVSECTTIVNVELHQVLAYQRYGTEAF